MKFSTVAFVLGLAATASAQRKPKTLKDYGDDAGIYIGNIADDHYMKSDPTYMKLLEEEFNFFTPENKLKWEAVQPEQGIYNFTGGDYAVNWAQSKNMGIRGHTFAWHSQLAPWVNAGPWTKASLTQVLIDHINTVGGHYKNKLHHWDVANEIFEEDGSWRKSIFYNTIGPEFVEIAFRTAMEADPEALLWLNDYNIDGLGPKSDAYFKLAKELKKKLKTDIYVGMQGHQVVGQLPTTIEENLRRFSDAGIEVAFTEIDIRGVAPMNATMLNQQRKDYEYMTRSCVNVKRCLGLTIWGLSDRYSWVPGVFAPEGEALLWDENYNKKPAYYGVVDGLTKKAPKKPKRRSN